MKAKTLIAAVFAGALALATTGAQTEDTQTDVGTLDRDSALKAFPDKPPYSPYAGRNFPTRPFFGDTHTHTSFSMDAGAFGCRLGPKDAYRFAKGEEIMASSGQRGETLPATRFPGGDRSLGRFRIFSATDEWRSGAAGDPARPQMV